MNCGIYKHLTLGILLFCALLFSCEPETLPPSPNEITPSQRELLGTTIVQAILDDSENFSILPNNTSQADIIYRHLQNLYNQASFFMKNEGTAANGWDSSKEWLLRILISDEKLAFCVPGGDFFVSTAMLQSIEYEFELYYLMTFEMVLMNDRHLLNKLVSYANNADVLNDIALYGSSNGTSAAQLALEIAHNLTYDEEGQIRSIDEQSILRICESSSMNRQGIIPLLSKLNAEDSWLTTRPSYAGRQQYIVNGIALEDEDKCGNEKWTTEGRTFFVENIVNHLP